MGTVTVKKPSIITLEYRQQPEDTDYGTCLWAVFHIDTERYSLSIMSDCGNFSYGWHPTPNAESFLQLLGRMDKDYLLSKIASPTVVDTERTFDRVMEYLHEIEKTLGKKLEAHDIEMIRRACGGTDLECLSSIKEALFATPIDGQYRELDLAERICLPEGAGPKKIAEVFKDHIQPMVETLKTHHDSQPNEPLTEDQLKKMDGEAVFAIPKGKTAGHMGIVAAAERSIVCRGGFVPFTLFRSIYRHRPEEV